MTMDRADLQRMILLLGSLEAHLAAAMAGATGADLGGRAHVAALFSLDLDGPQRPGALQEATGLSSGGVSKLVDRLEAAGLVARSFGPVDGDRRAVLVKLTSKGRRTVRRMAEAAGRAAADRRELLGRIAGLIGS